jgi:phospholipid/cholesterol/gamma-HCH transport system permease protein
MSGIVVLPKRLRADEVVSALEEIRGKSTEGDVTVDFGAVEEFDSSTLAFLVHVAERQPGVTAVNVPDALVRAEARFARPPAGSGWPERPAAAGPSETRPNRLFQGLADRFLARAGVLRQYLAMLGDELYHIGRFLKNRRGVYPGETWNQMFFMGYGSFPIVCLLLFLVGVTISITSANQMKLFGAEMYIADLVGYAMLRELVPLMTGVILAGKVGAAVTAELASMSVLEEVDALRTMGLVPEKFLMVPRLLAITLVVPLLVAMADVSGILGGMVVARLTFGMPFSAFLKEMITTVDWTSFAWGLVKTVVFGWAVLVGSGFKGLSVGRSAEEVGRATTGSVVLSIIMIIVIDCIFAFVLY